MSGDVYRVRDKLPVVLAQLPQLPQGSFARCHNSYAVNLVQVAEIRASDPVLQGGICILVSRVFQALPRAVPGMGRFVDGVGRYVSTSTLQPTPYTWKCTCAENETPGTWYQVFHSGYGEQSVAAKTK